MSASCACKLLEYHNIYIYKHTYTNNCTTIVYNDTKTCGELLTYFGLFWPPSERYSTKKTHYWLVISKICNSRVKLQNIKLLKTLKLIVENYNVIVII